MGKTVTTLDKLKRGQIGKVVGFGDDAGTRASNLIARLREIGFAETDEVELLHKGPFLGRPLCFRLNRTQIALRPAEARAIQVELQI